MNLLKSLISVGSITLISRVLGFFRDVLIAKTFGTSMFTDAFFVAFKIPNLLRRIFSEETFSQVFIPVLIEYKILYNKYYMRNFISSVFGLIIFVLSVFTVLGMYFSHSLILITAPGFTAFSEKAKLTEHLLIMIFPYVILITLTSFFSSILNTWNYFSVSACAPIFLNLSIIFFSVFFNSIFNPPIFCLVWAVIIGGILQFFYQFPFLYKKNILVMPNLYWTNPGLLKILKKIGPLILNVSMTQLSLVINTIFGSLLSPGTISWMYYADRLIEFPIGILGVSLGTILFTSLTKSYKNGIMSEYKKSLNWGLKIGFMLALPSSIILFFLAKPLIMILFQYGKFTELDVLMTKKILESYSLGLISFILVKILSSAFYAYEEISIPTKISIITLLLGQLINPIFIFYFKHTGLALSVSMCSWINCLFLYLKLREKNVINFEYSDIMFFFRTILSTLIMTLILCLMLYIMPSWNIGTVFSKIIRLCFICIVSGIGYISVLNILGTRLSHLSYNILKL
ncbi:MAG: murein biosynthesis integral membrane protein MurJ [Buchnera aphidicola (Pentalonia nigronervosa)]|uniref:Probable lipid II flippase MurJ n=1 Tax=Buchnera aphidicola (Pentalonia nigronervosa) TaxID=1309793 RepID=A0A7H1B040_9GAMM|nr:MAG: murein biosynthesis integral membrane protein MurJ [Buchnera aphidicola (Pentalonia nigronervosa)]